MRHVLLRDSDGRAHRLAHVADATDAGDLEPLAEWDTRRLTSALPEDELLRLWHELDPAAAATDEPPSDAELRRWADEELAGPTARLRVWREPRPLHASGSAGNVDRALAARAIDLASLAPCRHWVEIRVVDPDGEPLRGVGVTLWRPDGAREHTTTNAEGVARWAGLPDGQARVLFDESDDAYREVR